MFRASLYPSSGEQDRVLLHVVFCTGCAGCGCVELGHKLCALCENSVRCTTWRLLFGELCEGYCSVHCVKVTVRCTVWRLLLGALCEGYCSVHCVKVTARCTVWRLLLGALCEGYCSVHCVKVTVRLELCICLQEDFEVLEDAQKNAFGEYCHNLLNTADCNSYKLFFLRIL